VNQIKYNTFEVKMTNTRSKESANFIVRPVDMISIGPSLQIETMDVHDLQTGRTESWTSDDPQPDGGIVYAIAMMFWDNKELQKKLWTIVDQSKDQDLMPGLNQRRSIGQEVDADAYIDSQEKTQAAMAKMKKGVSENYHSDLMKQTYAKFFKTAPAKTVSAVKKFLSDRIISLGTAQDNDYDEQQPEEISWEQDLSDVRQAYEKLSTGSPNWFDLADAVLSYDTEFRESMIEWAEEELGSKLVDFLWDEVWEAKHQISRSDGSYNVALGHQNVSGQKSDRDSYKPWDPEKDPPNPFADLKWIVMINGEQKVKFGGVSNNQKAAMKVAINWARNHGHEREVQAGKIEVVQVQPGPN
jgi:hypothetical protein